MLQNKQNILLVVIALLLCYNLFTTRGIKTDVKGYKDRIEAIKTKVDSAQVVNKQIDTKIDSVKENVVAITKEIHHIDNTITIVKNQTNEKVFFCRQIIAFSTMCEVPVNFSVCYAI